MKTDTVILNEKESKMPHLLSSSIQPGFDTGTFYIGVLFYSKYSFDEA